MPTTKLVPGQRVEITGRYGLDREFAGCTGTLEGYTHPRGFARVRLDVPHPGALPDGTVLVHPEGVEALTDR